MNETGAMQQALSGLLDPEERFKADESAGKKILATAWVVEIIAAAIGLFIAWTQAWRAIYNVDDPNFNHWLNAILGALPFLLIAIIEPMKIPLAAGLYRVKHFGWKLLILFGLLGLTAVTFETMLTGLETQNYNVTRVVTDANIKILKVNNELETKVNKLREIEDNTKEKTIVDSEKGISAIRDSANENRESINKEMYQRVNPLIERKKEIQDTIGSLQSLDDSSTEGFEASILLEKKGLNEQLEGIRKRRGDEINDYRKLIVDENKSTRSQSDKIERDLNDQKISIISEIKDLNNRQDQARESYIKSVQDAKNLLDRDLSSISKRFEQELSDCNFGCGGVRTRKSNQENTSQAAHQLNLETLKTEHNDIIEKIDVDILRLREKEKGIAESPRSSVNFEAIDPEKIEGINRRYATQIKRIEKKIEDINDELGRIRQEQSGRSKLKLAQARKQLETTDDEIKYIQDQFGPRLEAVTAQMEAEIKALQGGRERELNSIEERRGRIGGLKNDIESLRSEKDEQLGKKRVASMESPIYRLTALVYGVSDIVDIKQEQLKWVSGVWFGSIAFIAATVGTVLALISFILRDPQAFTEKERWYRTKNLKRLTRLGVLRVFSLVRALTQLILRLVVLLADLRHLMNGFFGRKLQRSVRRLNVSFRKKLHSPRIKIIEKEVEVVREVIKEVPVDRVVTTEVEVIKEVPVDRVVTTEVLVEVFRERVIHVPIASDDLSILEITGKEKDSE
jgi:hypothetical protein